MAAPTKESRSQLPRIGFFLLVLILTVDELNPVKILLQAIPWLSNWHVAILCLLIAGSLAISALKEVLYFAVKMFFHSILSIFFRQVQVIGRANIPRSNTPFILAINHANQFMDAVMVLTTCGSDQRISYLMAEASWKRRVVGDIAWAMDVVPVKRAQDSAQPGTGRVKLVMSDKDDETSTKSATVEGSDTKFRSELTVGDKLRLQGTATGLRILSIESDQKVVVQPTDAAAVAQEMNTNNAIDTFTNFDILQHVDTKIVFEKVLDKLAAGGAVGIFPEGGSHDRTELLPLKAGVALIAYGALERTGQPVPIVPVGLNYFRAHRWRGRAVIEYGAPVLVDPGTLPAYLEGGSARRTVCQNLLDEIETAMQSVIVSTPDFETLEIIHTARRLYQQQKNNSSSSQRLSTMHKQDLTRRFAEGYKRLMLQTNGKPPPEWLNLQQRLLDYRNELKDLGLQDYQVVGLAGERLESDVDGDAVLSFLQLVYQIMHLLCLLALAAVPVLCLNLPVGLLAGLYSERRRQRALAKSKVKIRGYDVMLTEKVLFCLVMVPVLWIIYGVALAVGTNWDRPTIALVILSMPLFAYMGIIVSEAGMVDWKDLRPYFIRLSPTKRRQLASLPKRRLVLQSDLRHFIRSIGPGLGEIYYKTEVDWKEIMDKSKSTSNKKTS